MPQVLVDTRIEHALLDELAESTGLSVELAPGELDTRRDLPKTVLRDVRAMLCTYLPTLFQHQQQAVWDRGARFQQEVRGRTLGIWGYGGIGRETARLAAAMGLRIHVLTRTGRIEPRERFRVPGTGDDDGSIPERVYSTIEAEQFCQTLDFLLLAIPHTPSNEGLINRRIFESLPDRAFLLNPARGRLVCEADLLWALETGQIAGAALDTHFHYPLPPDHPLWQMPNVILTPHISGSTESPHFRRRLWQLFCDNVRRWQAGQTLYNRLSQDQLEPGLG